MPPHLTGLTKLTLETAPTVCHECIWWQTRGRRTTDKGRWMEKVELDFGAWGTVYYDGDRRVLGSMQYGPAQAFPRAFELPGGPPSDGSILVTCAYLVDPSSPWVLQSLFLAAIGEARDRGAACLEAFSYRYAEARVELRAVPRPPHGVPAGLPRRLRVPGRALCRPRRAVAARARRPAAGGGGEAREGARRRAQRVRRAGARADPARAQGSDPVSDPASTSSESSSASSVSKPGAARVRQPADLEDQRHVVERAHRREVDVAAARAAGDGSSPAAACPRRGRA